MLTFIGLGLYDERSVTVKGQEALRNADRAFAEFYTSRLVGSSVEELEAYHGVDIERRDRAGVEREPEPVLEAAAAEDVAFLTAGDTMISTTHVDLQLRAHERGIETRVIHGISAQSAAAGLTGLQNYRFGKATTLPFPGAHGGEDVPASVVDTIAANRERDLHTLVYLDIKVDDPTADAAGLAADEAYMSGDDAAALLADGWTDDLAVVVARAGSPEPVVVADRLSALADQEFGGPLHLLVVPAEPHHLEADALEALAGAPSSLLGRE